MATLPANALMAARAVLPHPIIDDAGFERTILEEVVAKRDGTKFWYWTSWYVQMAAGPRRCTRSAEIISHSQAIEHAERMNIA